MTIGKRLLQAWLFALLSTTICLLGAQPASAQTACEPLASDKGQLSFTVINVGETGVYNLWLRFIDPTEDRNSLWVQVDDQCPVIAGDGAPLTDAVWVHDTAGDPMIPLAFNLTAGDHTVTFAGREAKTGLDKFVFTNNLQCIPVGPGDNCLTTGAAPASPTTIKTVAKNSLAIFIICGIFGVGALGFLLWKFLRYNQHNRPGTSTSAPGTIVGRAPRPTIATKLGGFIKQHRLSVAVCVVIIIASAVVGIVFAASTASFEAETGTLTGGAQTVEDIRASDGKYVLFDTSATTPGETPQPSSTPGASQGGGSSGGGGGSSGGGQSGGGGGGSTPLPASSECNPFPDANCTGYAHTGVTLHACSLPLVNPTYDSCLFTGEVNVSAANITVTRSKILGIVTYRTSDGGGLRNLTLTDVEIDSTGWQDTATIGNNDYTCNRCNIHGGMRGASLGSNATIKDSYLHSWNSEPGDHITGLSGHGGSNNIVNHNNISCNILNDPSNYACSSGMSIYGDDAPGNSNWTITNNLFNSGSSYCVAIVGTPSKPYPFTNMTFTGNTFGSYGAAQWGVPATQCTEYGPINTQSSSWGVNGNAWSGNVNSQGGTVNP